MAPSGHSYGRPRIRKMSNRWPAIIVIASLVAGYVTVTGTSAPAQTQNEPAKPGRLPPKALIPGVPFVSWRKGASYEEWERNYLNPSFPASVGMILKYWGQSLARLKKVEKPIPSGWTNEGGEASGLDEVKPFIARGIPVYVAPALTPVAHTPSPTVAIEAAMGLKRPTTAITGSMPITGAQAQKYQDLWSEYTGPSTGVLGRMESFDKIQRIADSTRLNPWESLLESKRVIIGYDDERRVVVLHDPSFGPAWEVGYDDFELMWGARDRPYNAFYPPNYAEVLAKRSAAPPYPARTPDQRAAAHFVFGYALRSVGRMAEAEANINKGLAIREAGKGYRHLLLLEQALHLRERGELEKSNETLQQAIKLLREHHRPWQYLAENYRNGSGKDWKRKATKAEKKAKALCESRKAMRKVSKKLGRDFFIFGCKGLSAQP